ncbi:unnamed protein product [Leuciscus chuanchicus]
MLTVCYQKAGLLTEVKNSGKVQQISVPFSPMYLGEPSFDLQVMPDHANSFADRRSADVLSCSVFVAICDRCAQEFGPSPSTALNTLHFRLPVPAPQLHCQRVDILRHKPGR